MAAIDIFPCSCGKPLRAIGEPVREDFEGAPVVFHFMECPDNEHGSVFVTPVISIGNQTTARVEWAMERSLNLLQNFGKH